MDTKTEETTKPVKPAKKAAAPKAPKAPKDERGDLAAKIKELEAKIAAGEEAALARVCKALNIDPSSVTEAQTPKPEEMIRCYVGHECKINGRSYLGEVTVPYLIFEMLQEMLGKRRQRLLRELTGNNYILKELQGGGMTPVRVGGVDANGERIQ